MFILWNTHRNPLELLFIDLLESEYSETQNEFPAASMPIRAISRTIPEVNQNEKSNQHVLCRGKSQIGTATTYIVQLVSYHSRDGVTKVNTLALQDG